MITNPCREFFCGASLVDKYLFRLEVVKNYSKYTLRNYRSALEAFMCVLSGRPVESVSLSDVRNFRLKLKEKGLCYNYAQLHLIVLRQFLKFCWMNDIPTLHYNKIEVGQYARPPVPFLERSELDALFSVCYKERLMTAQAQALVRLLYSTGCRVSEIVVIAPNLRNKHLVHASLA